MVKKALVVALGIMFGAAAVGVAYPLIIGLPESDQNIIPRFASQWYVGKGEQLHPTMQYLVQTPEQEFLVKIHFLPKQNEKSIVSLEIFDKKTGGQFSGDLSLGSIYNFEEIPDELIPYTTTLDKTIFAIRDVAIEKRYLVVDAIWGTTFVGKFNPQLVLTEFGPLSLDFDELQAYTVSYTIGDNENKFWIVDDLPLPVKAHYYDFDGNFSYSYELVDLVSNESP